MLYRSRPLARLAPALVAVGLLSGLELVAAQPVPAVSSIRTRSSFRNLSYEAGLPHAYVLSIAQDGVGLMWFGTDNGLARYDGVRMTVFRGPGAPTGSITALAGDSAGRIWVGTGFGEVHVFELERGQFRKVASPAQPGPQAAISALLVLPGDVVWASTGEGAILAFDPGAKPRRVPFDGDADRFVSAMTRGAKGAVWVATSEGRVLELDTGGRTKRELSGEAGAGRPFAEEVTSLLFDSTGHLWIGTSAGARRVAPDGKTASFRHDADRPSLIDDRVTAFLEDGEGDIWVGTVAGLSRLHHDSARIDSFVTDWIDRSTLPSPLVTTGFRDRGGVLWFGTWAGGVASYDPWRDGFNGMLHGLSAAQFVSADRMWAASAPGELTLFDLAKQTRSTITTIEDQKGQRFDLRLFWITALHVARAGDLWIGVRNLGLVHHDPATGKSILYRPTEELPGLSEVFRIVPDRAGKLWLATWGGGLISLDLATMQFAAHDEDERSLNIYNLVFDRADPNLMWIGTGDEGLLRFDLKSGRFAAVLRPDTEGKRRVMSIYQDPRGILWLGTYGGGLLRYDPAAQQVTSFDSRQGLPETVVCVLGDKSGRIWFATEGAGLVVLDPKTEKHFAYDFGDGVPQEFSQNACSESPDGRLMFAGPPGIVLFDPEAIRRDDFAPTPVLSGVEVVGGDRVLGRPWAVSSLETDYDESLVALRFSMPSYSRPDRNRYYYRIDDTPWIETHQGEVVVSLTPGDHDLAFRAVNRHGVEAKEQVALALTVRPPWWRSWWAYSTLAAFALLAGFAFVRYQQAKLRASQNKVRLELMERDLELTASVQAGFLPRTPSYRDDNMELFGCYRPAQQCSGDWWWYERTNSTLTVVVGDVTGHGPGPAMVTAAVATAFRVAMQQTVAERLERLNDEVAVVGQGKYLMSMTAIELHLGSGQLRVFSAGGLPPLVVTRGRPSRSIAVRGTPLGGTSYSLGMVDSSLDPGDRILLFTDGIVELRTKKGSAFGLRRLSEVFAQTQPHGPIEAAELIQQTAMTSNAGATQDDDWTFVIVDWGR